MGQAMGSNGERSAVPCETSLMQASLPGPLPRLGSRGTGCPLRLLSLTASLPCTRHTCTHPAFIQSPGCRAAGGLGAGSEQAEPRVWAREREWGHGLSPALSPLHLSSLSSSVCPAPPLLLLHLFLLSLLLLHLSSSPPPPLQQGKGNRGVCPREGPRPGAQLWSPAGWGGGVAALTLGSLLVGAGKRGRRNSVGSLDSTIEVSASSCPTCPLHEPCPAARGAPEEEGTCCFPLFPAGNPAATSPSRPLSQSVLNSVCPHSACLSVYLPLSQAPSQPQGRLQVVMPLELGPEKLLPPSPAL